MMILVANFMLPLRSLRMRFSLVLVVLAGLFSAGAYAQTCTVSSTADSGANTLRSCLTSPTSGVAITISATGTITLASALPPIAVDLTIIGPGANQLTVSGSNAYQVFNISSGTVSISGLTIANGAVSSGGTGGGIQNADTLTVANDIFSGNVATRGMGGGIYSDGSLTVQNCTFVSNSSQTGAGIYVNSGTATVTNSTFANNISRLGGGGIGSAATLNVTNSTFSGNSAFGAGGEGGAIIDSSNTTTVNNSIFSGNTAGDIGAGIYNSGATVNADSNVFYNNLDDGISEDDCNSCAINSNETTDNPQLAPLGNYGGPTETMALLTRSVATCVGTTANATAAGVTADQRGFALDPSCPSGYVDAGAVQTNQFVVSTLSDTTDATTNCNPSGTGTTCSLRDAITLANSFPTTYATGGDVTIPPRGLGLPGTITLGSALPSITGQVNIIGPQAYRLTISGNNDASVGSVLTVDSGAEILFYGMTIANGNSTGTGGGIDNSGTMTVIDAAISGNNASVATGDRGGGIENYGTLTLIGCTVSGNTVGAIGNGGYPLGGGIANESEGTLILTDSTVSGNVSSVSGSPGTAYGGGISSYGTVILNSSTVSGNSANGSGGASGIGGGIWIGDGTLTLANSIVAGSSATTEYADIEGSYTDNGGNQASSNISATSAIAINLAPLANYGGDLSTQVPLPGSPAICAGLTGNIPSGTTTDQRGYPNTNTTYTSGTCVDAGSVQTNYQSVQFSNVPGGGAYTALINTAANTAPNVIVTENGQYMGAVPVTLTDASLTVSGLGPVTTVATVGATFGSIEDTAAEDTSLVAALQITPAAITPPYILSASALFDTTSPSTPASLSTPTPGTTLTGTSVAFTWAPGTTTHVELWIGTTGPGSTNLYNSGSVTVTTETVSNLPSNGQPVYVRLYSYLNGAWVYSSYTYTAYGSPTPATLTTPAPGSTLTGTSVAFAWTPGNVSTHYELWVGTTAGSTNLYNSGSVTSAATRPSPTCRAMGNLCMSGSTATSTEPGSTRATPTRHMARRLPQR